MIKAAFPGSFDPPTLGHISIIERAAGIFDELLVVIAENREGQKRYLFSASERAAMILELTAKFGNVRVEICDTLIVDFLRAREIKVIARGVRGVDDFSYEFELAMMNKVLDCGIETIFFACDPQYFMLKSSFVKEIASFNGEVRGMVPPLVEEALKKKFS